MSTDPIGPCDVAVVGDGPAGSALAWSLQRRGVDVVLVGAGEPWSNTYMSWCDDLDGLDLVEGVSMWSDRFESVRASFGAERTIRRPYGAIDNRTLRAHLQAGVRTQAARVEHLAEVDARLIIDATGWPSGLDPSDAEQIASGTQPPAWQTAFGVVLDEAPDGPLGEPTVMDFGSPWSGGPTPSKNSVEVPTFAYSFPVHDGWLVEETVLAGPLLDPDDLVGRLSSRLELGSDELLGRATRVERVRIPMGAPIPSRRSDHPVVRFGASAGMIHTATGYSLAASLRAASRVADAIAERLAEPRPLVDVDLDRLNDVVWPASARRSRHLQLYGLDVLLTLDRAEIAGFFDAFFDLGDERWPPYMRIDTEPVELARVMAAMFVAADWKLRRRLLRGNPRALLAVLRP